MNTSQPDPRAYMKLAALIRDQVASGELAPGDRLSMRVLCDLARRDEVLHELHPHGVALEVQTCVHGDLLAF
jgi:hypothetical protein